MDNFCLFGFETRLSDYFYVDRLMLHLVSYAMWERIPVHVLQCGPSMVTTEHWMSSGHLLLVDDC